MHRVGPVPARKSDPGAVSVRKVAAVIVAAGRGARAGGSVPKQFQEIAGRAVLAHTVGRFRAHPRVSQLVVVLNPADSALADAVLPADVVRVAGGDSRDASVEAGLAALGPEISHVLVHDGARPLVPLAVIDGVLCAYSLAEPHPIERKN